MKKLTTLLTAAAMVFVMSGKAQAVPFYYTFDGTVSYVNDDPTGAIAAAGFSVGSNVTYTFIVDFDADGTDTLNDGTVFTYTDTASQNYFYADYVSGDALAQVDGGYYNSAWNVAEHNYGYSLSSGGGSIVGNSRDDTIQIMFGPGVQAWGVGAVANAYDHAAASGSQYYSLLTANMTLTDISPVNAVPEPSTLLLLGSGMLGLLAFRRRQLTTQV